jgi:hypothetical protein
MVIAMQYFKFRWNETPGGDRAHWGNSWWYFEVRFDGYVARQIELYDTGPRLRYGPGHDEDQFGGLSISKVEGADLAATQESSEAEFEAVWQAGGWSNDSYDVT